ncbi:helix-turn-helix domain-containing protein [Polaromonas glacialis]|uniref:helix-turn-helix domain-containing protein n=1 Tax=Polaromonas glacialis TaxID=866564 RepID=UPI000A064CF4|nr:LysR family transcriptional regulator [Polaromonas glacialis]
MKLHQLRNFFAIVEKVSISAAAKYLDIAQPSLSRSIRKLEKELGIPLSKRHVRGPVLTPLGTKFSKSARLSMIELEKGSLQETDHSVLQGRFPKSSNTFP